jgi:PAS domain S-box-containing protein
MFLHRFSRWIIRDYSSFKQFLRQASNENIEIDEDNLRFTEIRELAGTANNLVRTRSLATEQMEIEKLYLERLLESAPEGIVVTDKKGYILRVNDRFLAIFKYAHDEVMGKHIDDLIAPEEFRKEADQYTLLVGEGKELSRETIRQTREKERIYVSILATPIISGKGEEAFYVIYRDITDRKMAEKQLKVAMEKAKESDRLKTAFLSNMSHEIRTPLNAIVGFSELITNTKLEDSEKKEYAGLISQNSKMLVTLINDIIDVSKIESGQLQIVKKDTNLNDLMRSVYDSFTAYQNQTAKEHIDWIYEENNTDHCIKTDSDRLRQILTNLITNAFKFTHKGSVKMGYSLDEGMVRFYVKDTGIGIASADLKKIFVRFQQADISSTRKYGGTGLGLAISKSLVKLLGGVIHVKSEPNRGSEFTFTLPDEPCTGMQNSQEDSADSNMAGSKSAAEVLSEQNTILIVEDEDSNFMYLKAVLQPRGYSFVRATRAEKAIEIVKNNPGIGMVLMDVQLPDFSGYEATRIIKELRPELPVVAQTAYAMADEKEKSLEAGCNAYLSKPINKGRLLEIIKTYIS